MNFSSTVFRPTLRTAVPAVAAALALAAPLAAQAQAPTLNDTWAFRVGAYFPSIDTKARAEALGRFGTTIDFETDLRLKDSKTLPIIDVDLRFAQRHRVTLNYLDLQRDATARLDTTLTWQGVDYTVGTNVRGEFKSRVAAVSYYYSLYQTKEAEVALGAGIHGTKLEAGLSVEGTNLGTSKSASANAPLPVLAARGAMKFSDSVTGELRYQWFGIKYGDYDGSLNVLNAGVAWYPWKGVGAELGYNYSKYDIKVSKDAWNGEAKYKFNGPVLSLVASF